MSKCLGCGIKLQWDNMDLPGYSLNEDHLYCQRCFKIKNYHSLSADNKYIDNNDLIAKINKKGKFTFFLCDFLALNDEVVDYYKKIINNKMFIVTKCDILPSNIHLAHLRENIRSSYGIENVLLLSIKSNLNINNVINIIEKEKEVIIAGPTNGGKSTLINYLTGSDITVSNFKNTTQDFITINYETYKLIDAPGFNSDYLKDNIKYKGIIKPKIIRMKAGYSLFVDEYEISFEKQCNLTLYFPNEVKVLTKKSLEKLNKKIVISGKNDLVLNNLGFIYLKDTICYINKNDYVSVRKSVIGGK